MSGNRWYPRPDSNRHGSGPGDFKSPVSTIPPRGPASSSLSSAGAKYRRNPTGAMAGCTSRGAAAWDRGWRSGVLGYWRVAVDETPHEAPRCAALHLPDAACRAPSGRPVAESEDASNPVPVSREALQPIPASGAPQSQPPVGGGLTAGPGNGGGVAADPDLRGGLTAGAALRRSPYSSSPACGFSRPRSTSHGLISSAARRAA